jgi:hypothetical protein
MRGPLERDDQTAANPQRERSINASAARDKTPDHSEESIGLLADDTVTCVGKVFMLGGVVRVHARSQIARTRADFEQFSAMSGNQETEVWSGAD